MFLAVVDRLDSVRDGSGGFEWIPGLCSTLCVMEPSPWEPNSIISAADALSERLRQLLLRMGSSFAGLYMPVRQEQPEPSLTPRPKTDGDFGAYATVVSC
jgi:hypothetical protein